MIKLKSNLFTLSETYLQKKRGEENYSLVDIIDTAIKIRKYLDKNEEKARGIYLQAKKKYYNRNNYYQEKNADK